MSHLRVAPWATAGQCGPCPVYRGLPRAAEADASGADSPPALAEG